MEDKTITIKNMAVKSNEEFLFTAPVMIPDRPDCDYHRGEKPFTAEEIKFYKESFDDYQIIDKNHQVFHDIGSAKSIGEPKESFLLEKDTPLEFTDGTVQTYPRGTWMLTTNVTDPIVQQEILTGKLTGYSPSVNSEDIASLIKRAMAMKSSQGQLIHDIPNPRVVTVSIVGKPCQAGSKACKLKDIRSDNMSDEKKTLDKIREVLGAGEKPAYATKSDFEALAEEIKQSNDASLKSLAETIGNTVAKSISEALAPLGAVKSNKEDDDDDDESGDNNQEPTKNDESEDNNQEPTNEDDDDNKQKKKGSSKQGKIHNGATKSNYDEDLDTYAFLGRNPDGTRKKI